MSFDFGCGGQSSTTRFHGLFSGNTSSAARMVSASGVSNDTGLSIFGIVALRMRSTRAGSPDTTGFFESSANATAATAMGTTERASQRIGNLGEEERPPINAERHRSGQS